MLSVADIGVNQLEANFKDGCMSVRLKTMEKQRAAMSPGPVYEVMPCIGRQVQSTLPSAPLVGFTREGTATEGRPIENVGGKGTPGPKVRNGSVNLVVEQYELDCITYGRQVQSRMRTACMPSFGSSQRQDMEPKSTSPGPHTAYFVTRPDQRGPSPSIAGPTWRNRKSHDLNYPGPGAYNIPAASGKQVLSTKPSLPLVSFGGSNIKRDLAKPKSGNEPGPGQYDPKLKSGNIRAITFGSGPQRPITTSKFDLKPAPNKYVLPSALGNQLASRKVSAPSYSFGAR